VPYNGSKLTKVHEPDAHKRVRERPSTLGAKEVSIRILAVMLYGRKRLQFLNEIRADRNCARQDDSAPAQIHLLALEADITEPKLENLSD